MIIHLASEVAPFYKRGGLGDVVGTLPHYLSKRQENAVISFYYKNRMKRDDLAFINSFPIQIQNITYEFNYYHYKENAVHFYFLNMSDRFLLSDMESGESDSTDDDGEKPYGENFPFMVYLYFAKAALQLIKILDMKPDYLMFHDWHVCGCFAYPKIIRSLGTHCSTLVLIHNYEHQGEIFPDQMHLLDEEVLQELLPIYDAYGTATFFALAFKNADYVSTVSASYAKELFEGVLPHTGLKFLDLIKKKKIYALPNGIDDKKWSPKYSPYLDKHYDIDTRKDIKKEWRKYLHEQMGFQDDGTPVVLMMNRLTEQKGINILIDLWSSEDEAMQQIHNLLNQGIKLIVYGRPAKGLSGSIHKRLSACKKLFSGQFNYVHQYTEEKAHQFLAGSDMVLCPSLFEPCGLVQMFALAFGTTPIVRPVGGLKDTVIPHDEFPEKSMGFYIRAFEHESPSKAIRDAVEVYKNQPEIWERIVERGMQKDYSWEHTINNYEDFLDRIKKEYTLV